MINRNVRNFYAVVSLIIMGLLFPVSPLESVFAEDNFLNIRAGAALLADGDSGRILYTQNPDQLLPTASMAKMMTEYLVLEAINENRISWDQEFQISDYAYRISQNLNLSNVPLRRNEHYKVRELYEAMAIYSANGATIALAELIAGSEDNFIKMMTEKAEELGLKDFKFVNSTGLNNRDLLGEHPVGTGSNEENLMSARATAKLAYHLIHDYPEVFQFSSIPKKTFRKGTRDEILMPNWNYMLPELVYGYEGMDGLKTGSTERAGFNFTGTAKRGDVRLISVVMKADSIQARFAETRKLMNYGFSNYVKKEIAPAGFQLEGQSEIPVEGGRETTVEVQAEKPLIVLVKRGEEELFKPVYQLDKSMLTKNGALRAPLEKGTVVGKVVPEYTGKEELVYLTVEGRESVNLVTVHEVERAGLFTRLIRALGRLLSGLWQSILNLIK